MKKVCDVINKIYGVLMMTAFFGGLLPIFPFIAALIIGGTTGEQIAVFLYKQYYPWVIAMAAIAVLVGLIGMYLGKQQGLSLKNIGKKEDKPQ